MTIKNDRFKWPRKKSILSAFFTTDIWLEGRKHEFFSNGDILSEKIIPVWEKFSYLGNSLAQKSSLVEQWLSIMWRKTVWENYSSRMVNLACGEILFEKKTIKWNNLPFKCRELVWENNELTDKVTLGV